MSRIRILLCLLAFLVSVGACSKEDVLGPNAGERVAVEGIASQSAELRVAAASGQTLYALTADGYLISFEVTNPGVLLSSVKITGLSSPRTRLVGIDFRPATGQLYALGNDSRIYTLDTQTAAASSLPASLAPALDGDAFGFDFNPTVDRIRIVSDRGQNMRAHPVTGAIVAVDGSLAYNAADINAGASPTAVGAGYTNSDTDTLTATTLYDIDASRDLLVTQVPPNSGTLNTVGALGVDVESLTGFDIVLAGGMNVAYAGIKSRGAGGGSINDSATHLLRVDLLTGAATDLGKIADAGRIVGLPAPITR